MKLFKYFITIVSAAAISPYLQGQDDSEIAPKKSGEQPVAIVAVEPAPEKEAELTAEQMKQLEIRLLNAKKAQIDAEIALGKARLAEKLAPKNTARVRIEMDAALRQARMAVKFAEIDAHKKKLDALLARDKVRDDLALVERGNNLRAVELDVKIDRLKQDIALARYNQKITQVKNAETLRGIVFSDTPVAYRKDPLENGRLYISDRRIEFNGAVTNELATYVTDSIYFYNNQNTEYPIFIVIDKSPGGSVFAGYQILKAMESSKAPVYVVVKTFAASMAAVITTAADRSFCYSGTVILHHQPSAGVKGNFTQMRESLSQTINWTSKITDKIAEKIGLTNEEFVAQMYKHNSRGDWSEFGDGAKKWKWVSDVVDTIEETSVVRKANVKGQDNGFFLQYKFDERGKPYIDLPTLPAGDAWMIYDPKNIYRIGA